MQISQSFRDISLLGEKNSFNETAGPLLTKPNPKEFYRTQKLQKEASFWNTRVFQNDAF